MSVSSVPAVEKIRGAAGQVIGFRDTTTGQIHGRYDSGPTRQRRLAMLSRKLQLFVFGEFGTCPTATECEALIKLADAIELVDKAGEMIGTEDRQRSATTC